MKNNLYKQNKGPSVLRRVSYWFDDQVFAEKLNNPLGYGLLIAASVAITFVITKLSLTYGSVFLLLLLGGAGAIVCLLDATFGLFLTIFLSFFIFQIKRYFGDELPIGAMVEVLLFITFIGIFTKKAKQNAPGWRYANNPITYIYMIYVLYVFIQAFNPEMDSIRGWLFIVRKLAGFMMAYFVVLYVFDLKFLKNFVKLWLALSLLAALYGCYQEWFGFLPFESDWVTQDEARYGLYFINGHFRKFSFLSDPAAFGILMATTGLLSITLAMGSFRLWKKAALILAGMIMFLAMAYSGTRTAYAMIPAGLVIFVLMTITHRSTLILTTLAVVVFAVLMFGPIYGNVTINRIRSTFQLSEDASLNVRDVNRARIQPYLYNHPIGGGLSTSGLAGMKYNPNHILAGFPPDSGYLRVALETGWIGLAITCLLYFVILYIGVKGYYRERNPRIRVYYVGIVTMIYALVIAQYAQVAISQLPGALLFYPALAIIGCLYRDGQRRVPE